jgi:hypothetical protein
VNLARIFWSIAVLILEKWPCELRSAASPTRRDDHMPRLGYGHFLCGDISNPAAPHNDTLWKKSKPPPSHDQHARELRQTLRPPPLPLLRPKLFQTLHRNRYVPKPRPRINRTHVLYTERPLSRILRLRASNKARPHKRMRTRRMRRDMRHTIQQILCGCLLDLRRRRVCHGGAANVYATCYCKT